MRNQSKSISSLGAYLVLVFILLGLHYNNLSALVAWCVEPGAPLLSLCIEGLLLLTVWIMPPIITGGLAIYLLFQLFRKI